MEPAGAGASSNGQSVQQEDESMMRAPKRALAGPPENEEPEGPRAHAARWVHAASIPIANGPAVDKNQLPQPGLLRDPQVQ